MDHLELSASTVAVNLNQLHLACNHPKCPTVDLLVICELSSPQFEYQRFDVSLIRFQHVRGPQGKNGFEYLGFRFDGRRVYVRDSTISRLYRKVALSAKGVARGFANAHPKLNVSEILATFNYSDFSQHFSRVHPDELSPDGYGTWTFYSYPKRASETFGERGAP
ncbi:MAG: hypothetical protein AAGK26_08780, partial [Pseudomonadota bacterium]